VQFIFFKEMFKVPDSERFKLMTNIRGIRQNWEARVRKRAPSGEQIFYIPSGTSAV
jgi:hypothetical protein